MSTALATMPEGGNQLQSSPRIDFETLEKLVAQGDLSSLTTPQRISYYQARCVACGLDPASQPFEYIKFQGKLILYAKKTATDQLTRLHRISLSILSRHLDPETGIYEVTCRAAFPDGRVGEDVGVMHIGTTKGEALAIALMKCVTKAKRRTVLSACGLGMLDETEVEDVESHGGAGFAPYQPAPAIEEGQKGKFPDQGSGHGRTGSYASKQETNDFLTFVGILTKSAKERWDDAWISSNKDIPPGLWELPFRYEGLMGHLFKRCVKEGKLKPVGMTLDPNTGMPTEKASTHQKAQMVAIVFHRDYDWLSAAANAYVAREEVASASKFIANNPHCTIPPEFDFEDEGSDPSEASQQTRQDRGSPEQRAPHLIATPETGDELFAFAKQVEQQLEIGILKYIASWAKLNEFPANMSLWSQEEVLLAFGEIKRKITGSVEQSRPEAKVDRGDAYEEPQA